MLFVANSFLWQNRSDGFYFRQIQRRMRHFRYFRTSRSLDLDAARTFCACNIAGRKRAALFRRTDAIYISFVRLVWLPMF